MLSFIDTQDEIAVEMAKNLKTDYSPQVQPKNSKPHDYHFIGSSFGRNSVPVLSEIFKDKQKIAQNQRPNTYDDRMNNQNNDYSTNPHGYISHEFEVNSPNSINTYRNARGNNLKL